MKINLNIKNMNHKNDKKLHQGISSSFFIPFILNIIRNSPFLFLTCFFVIPTILMVQASFYEPGEFGGLSKTFSLDAYQFFFEDSLYLQVFIKSFVIAGVVSLICLLLAYPLAYFMVQTSKEYQQLLVLLIILPFASSFLIRIYAWMFVLGPLDLMFSQAAVLIVLVYLHLPFMILPIYTNLEKHDHTLLDAAKDLGANFWQRFWKITFPLSMNGIYAGISLVFIPVLGMFAVPDLVGGTQDMMAGNLIKDQFLSNRDWPLGALFSLVLTVLVLLLLKFREIFLLVIKKTQRK
jgi:spermidine/putrescine transport system permease protein